MTRLIRHLGILAALVLGIVLVSAWMSSSKPYDYSGLNCEELSAAQYDMDGAYQLEQQREIDDRMAARGC